MDRATVIAESPDSVCIELKPSTRPVLPPEFDGNWYGLEGDVSHNWRWSLGNATIVLHNPGPDEKIVHVTFIPATLQPRHLQITIGSRQIYDAFLSPGQAETPQRFTVTLRPGKTELQFKTDAPAVPPGNGDPRKLAYNVTDFSIDAEEKAAAPKEP